jgi:hypothetical protein
MREEAFTNSNRHPLEFEFARQRRPPRLLPAIAGGITAAVGVAVVGALVFFNVVPKLRSDPSLAVSISTPASATAAQTRPESSQALLQGFVRFQQSQALNNSGVESEPASAGTAKASEKSQALLDRFIQWQRRTRDAPPN